MRGLPSILAAAPQRAWSATTGGIDYLKFNTQDQHFAIDPDIKITGLAGIYDADNGEFSTDALRDLITALAAIADSGFFSTGNMNDAGLQNTITDVNVTSAAALVHTCPTATMDEVFVAALRNSTRAPAVSLSYTPFGGTAEIIGPVAGAAAGTVVILGGDSADFNNAQPEFGMKGPLRMTSGDTLEIADGNFVAADVMRKGFIIRRFAA